MTEQDAGAIDSSGEEVVEGPLQIGQRVVDPSLVTGMKYLARRYSLMERLAPAGRERDAAGNRRLLFSPSAGLVLWGLVNPTLQSWRGLSEASRLRKVPQALGDRGPRGGRCPSRCACSIRSCWNRSLRNCSPSCLRRCVPDRRRAGPGVAGPVAGIRTRGTSP